LPFIFQCLGVKREQTLGKTGRFSLIEFWFDMAR